MPRNAAEQQKIRDEQNRANARRRSRDANMKRDANTRAAQADPQKELLDKALSGVKGAKGAKGAGGSGAGGSGADTSRGAAKEITSKLGAPVKAPKQGANAAKVTIPECAYAWEPRSLPTRKDKAKARLAAVRAARKNLLDFMQLMMPDPQHVQNATRSQYKPSYHHQIISDQLEQLHDGLKTRVILTCPPRHGKTALATIGFVAWYIGRNPHRSVIVGTYNSEYAEDIGRQVRGFVQSNTFRQIFPGVELQLDSRAADRLKTTAGGQAIFVGRGGAVTGRGGDLLIIDDPLKDAAEAASPTIRQSQWDWFNKTFMTRGMTDKVRVMLIQCMTGDTPVLRPDGSETPLRDIRPGDRVASYDPDTGGVVTETVLNHASQGADRVFEIRMKSGCKVRANARHPFLVVGQDGNEQWQRTDTLRPGQSIRRAIGGSTAERPARSMGATVRSSAKASARRTTIRIAGRAASALRLPTPAVVAQRIFATATALIRPIMSAFWPRRAACALSAGTPPTQDDPRNIGGRNSAWTIATTPAKSAGFFATNATSSFAGPTTPKPSKPPQITSDEIAEIVTAGVEEVFDLQVSRTENFIANGLVSHNTRWHEDDLIGRLTDPKNPDYSESEAQLWHKIDMPALCTDPDTDPLGRDFGDALWPQRFNRLYLNGLRQRDPLGFSALYQCSPAPPEGILFTQDCLVTYQRGELPKDLRIYMASDHAVSTAQQRDKTCIVAAGVDAEDNIWILPDIFWRQASAENVVDGMLDMIRTHKPLIWWAEGGMIGRSLGPFLRKRMQEESVYCAIHEVTPASDKLTRAQAIHGRAMMGKVRFPAFAPWWVEARDELMKFPTGTHDDFVDALAHLGRGLTMMVGSRDNTDRKDTSKEPPIGSLEWVKAKAREDAEASKRSDWNGW